MDLSHKAVKNKIFGEDLIRQIMKLLKFETFYYNFMIYKQNLMKPIIMMMLKIFEKNLSMIPKRTKEENIEQFMRYLVLESLLIKIELRFTCHEQKC